MSAYKRSIYLINPKFQLKFSGLVCLLVFISSLIYPFTIYDLLNSFITLFGEKSPSLSAQLVEKRESLIVILTLWQIGFTALVFIICIFFSHKIAGPMYKVQKFLAQIRDGGKRDRLYFRQGDYFPEVADDFNDTFEEIEERYQNDLVYLGEVTSYLNNLSMVVPDDKKAVLNEITTKLTEIQERFNQDS